MFDGTTLNITRISLCPTPEPVDRQPLFRRDRGDRTDQMNVRWHHVEHHQHVELGAYVLTCLAPEQCSFPLLLPVPCQVPDVRDGAGIVRCRVIVRQGVFTGPVPCGGHARFPCAILTRKGTDEAPRGRTLEQPTDRKSTRLNSSH